jgi:hypothetical protein
MRRLVSLAGLPVFTLILFAKAIVPFLAPLTYPNFAGCWLKSGGAEHDNYGLFLSDLCDLLCVRWLELTTDNLAQDAYVFERRVAFDDGAGKTSTGHIDLYKRGYFVLETKQGTNSPDQQAAAKAELGQPAERRRWGHAVRGTAKWGQMMEAARELAQQIQAVQAVVQQAATPLRATAVAARFRGATAKKAQSLLETLAILAMLRAVEEENAYVA